MDLIVLAWSTALTLLLGRSLNSMAPWAVVSFMAEYGLSCVFPHVPAMGRPETGPDTATERAVFNSSLHHHRYNTAESAKSKKRSEVHHRQLLQPHPFDLAQPDESHP